MRARRWLLAALLLVAAAGAGWWFGSPWWTLYQMKSAVERRDVAGFAGYVDTFALREDIAVQIGAQLGARGESSLLADDPSVRMAQGMVRKLMIGGVAATLSDSSVLTPIFGGAGTPRLGIRADDLEIRRDGLDQFRMVDKRGSGAELVFRRYGIAWKLAGIRLPKDRFWLGLGPDRQPEIGEGGR